MCIYHLPPSRRLANSKSYYPVFGRVNAKRGLPKLLPEQANVQSGVVPILETGIALNRCSDLQI